jgi:hypothetical protein
MSDTSKIAAVVVDAIGLALIAGMRRHHAAVLGPQTLDVLD